MKLVDSGESWLGKVPSDWTRTRIRNVTELSPGMSDSNPNLDEPCVVVPMESLSETGKIDTSLTKEFQDISGGLTLFENGDILFAKITPCMENGKGAYVEGIPTRYAFGSTEFHVLRPSGKIFGKFLYYYTFNPVYRAYAAQNMTGAAGQKRVSSRFLKDTRLFLPTLGEQESIVTFLDTNLFAIDKVASPEIRLNETSISGVLNRQLKTLLSYRDSLIHECVTGQRRITEADIKRVKAHG